MAKDRWTAAGADDSLSEPTIWDGLWKEHFGAYQGDIRHAYYIAAVRRRREHRILEMAAGSFRDLNALNRWGLDCEGVDFSDESVAKARESFPDLADKIRKMDAGRLEYPDRAFDLTFHNGLWVLFDDAQISVLAAEQARVTRFRMIATVHNAHNHSFKEKFAEWGKDSPLYRIRFFQVEEIESLMRTVCSRVTVLPVTAPRMDRLIYRRLGLMPFRVAYRLLGARQPLETSERLMCIGEVR